ncbi:hypothetical protein IMZ08_13775 [Bacillus luteolus]|uniref:Uncharacterized protein n=1 Tax=Litchfieldia luteola TaxID=682179 RepID=A0ABR9QKV5_9BACI|nr:hypothetical protein [Cytobacillus luteolus]MBE4909132.1 hypothetical protein [Cytobacillus luteolus]MBP1940417.1 hypothetical protein [Cytobacillus luteolus]
MRQIDRDTYWLVLLIIGGLSGLISSFIGPNLLHFLMFQSGDTILVQTPFLTNILTFIATGIFVMACIGMILERKIWTYAGTLLLVVSIAIGCYANLGYYTLVSYNDITIKNHMLEEKYNWEEIEEAKVIDNTNESIKKIQLTFKNGKEELLEINRVHASEIRTIRNMFLHYNIKLN